MKHSFTWKRTLALLTSFALLVSLLAACGAANVNKTDNSTDNNSNSTNNSVSSADETQSSEDIPDGFAAEPYVTLKWADHNNDGCNTALAMDEMAQQVYEATEGRVKIEVYHGGTLGSYADGLSMLETGVCDLLWTSVALFAGQFPYSEVLQLPMMGISNAQDSTNIFWDMMEEFPELFAPEFADYHLWLAHSMPAVVLGTKDKEVASLTDLKGLNLRAAAGSVATTATLWGAAPVSMSPADMYLSLQKGVIDGYIFDGAGINTWGLAELTANAYDMGLGYTMAFVLMSPKAWDSLTEEDQAILTEIGGRVGSQVGADFVQDEADTLFAGMDNYNVLSEGDPLYEELKAPLTSMTEDWIANNDGQAVIDFIQERVAFYNAQ